MLPNKPKKPEKPEIETKVHDYDPGKDEDIILKVGGFRLYFQNYYTIISLSNDLLTGVLYLSGSLIAAFTDLERLAMYLIFASFFLLMRPIIKIGHNVFLYNKKEYEQDVLGETEEK
ncbi:MAG: YrhK family protein [Alkalibacterium sp.]|nr:YrhK family protein [Alkalibacterium sp.]